MDRLTTVTETRALLKTWRLAGETIALIPTMGNLHPGHLELVASARARADKVVVSIFVNPRQFSPGEDYASYPRTESEDAKALRAADVDLLFMPSIDEMYQGESSTLIQVGEIANWLCGATRPGHFSGVATIVAKLFNIIQPDSAFFGLKDYQQWLVINQLVRDLNFPVSLYPVATVREADGLAMSSRNGYLTDDQRRIAPELYRMIVGIAEKLTQSVDADYPSLCEKARQRLQKYGFVVDYVAILEADSLLPARSSTSDKVILAAAKLGRARLIDNILCRLA